MALRILIVGLGGRGREWITQVDEHPDWELTGGVEVDPAAVRDASATIGDRPVYASLDEAFDFQTPDAVLIATSPGAHVEPTLGAIDRGVAAVVEKPLATSLDDARRLVESAESASRLLLVAQNHRYLRSHRTVRKVIHAGTLGEIRLVHSNYYRVPHQMAPSLEEMPDRIMWGMGVHHLDALRWTLGQEVTGALARSFSTRSSGPNGSSMDALLDFDGGTRGVYSATYESSGHQFFEAGQEFYERFIGSKGTLHVLQRWLVLCLDNRLPKIVRRGKRVISEEAVILDQARDAIRHGAEPDCSGADNLKTMAVVEACLRSAREQRWVDPQDFLHELV